MAKQDHLLIVDDDPQIRQLLCDYLSDAGFQVSTAADGKEMRRRLALNVIDLIVLDLMLPGEDGLSLCRELRVNSNTPVVMLTAKGSLIDRIVGLEIGADDYLPKPFDPRELLVRAQGLQRRVAVNVPHWGTAPGMIAGTDLILTVATSPWVLPSVDTSRCGRAR